MGCVPNKNINSSSSKDQRNTTSQNFGPMPPQIHQPNENERKTSQQKNKMTQSKRAEVEFIQQTKQNTFINSLSTNQRALRTSNVSGTPIPILKSPIPQPPTITSQTISTQTSQIPNVSNKITQPQNIKTPQKLQTPTQINYPPNFQTNNTYPYVITNFIPPQPVSPISYTYQNNINMIPTNHNTKHNIPQTFMQPMQTQMFRNPSIQKRNFNNQVQ